MEEKNRKIKTSTLLCITCIGGLIGTLEGNIHNLRKKIKNYQPQTRDVIIGDPNAIDPNDTYIQTPNGRAYLAIDGKSIEDYFK